MNLVEGLQKQRFQYADILRGLAALSVLFSHWSPLTAPILRTPNGIDKLITFLGMIVYCPPTALRGAHPGVIVFIVLSGFFIHLPVARQPDRQYEKGFWVDYAYRRLLRIGPVYWIACLLGLGSLMLAAAYPAYTPYKEGLSYTILDVLLKYLFLDGLYPSDRTTLGNGILSVVSIEVWLYAVYPLTLFVLKRARWLGVFVLAGLFHGVSVGLWLAGVKPAYVGISFWTFYTYWVIGAFAADKYALVLSGEKLPGKSGWWRVMMMFILYMVVGWSIKLTGIQIVRTLLLAITVACMLYSLAITELLREHRVSMVGRALKSVGEWSYSLYAVQMPVIVIAMMGTKACSLTGFLTERVVPLIAVFLMALLIYVAIERPFHRCYGRSIRRPVRGSALMTPAQTPGSIDSRS